MCWGCWPSFVGFPFFPNLTYLIYTLNIVGSADCLCVPGLAWLAVTSQKFGDTERQFKGNTFTAATESREQLVEKYLR